jgi:hypothetical protein
MENKKRKRGRQWEGGKGEVFYFAQELFHDDLSQTMELVLRMSLIYTSAIFVNTLTIFTVKILNSKAK